MKVMGSRGRYHDTEKRVFSLQTKFSDQKLVSGMYVDTKLWTCTHVKT